MDFIVGLPKVQQGYNAIWVVVDRLTKTAHFLPMTDKIDAFRLGQLYVKEIMRLHRVPKTIASGRDTRFISAS